MVSRSIETRAVISAEDRTGSTFSVVAQKMRGLEQTATRAGERVRASAWVAQQAAEKTRRAEAAAAAVRTAGGVGPAGLLAFGGGIITAALTMETIRALAGAIGERISQRTRTALAGYTPGEQKDMELRAARLSAKFTALGQNELMALQREAGTIVSREDVDKVIEPLAQLATVYKAQGKGADDLINVLRAADLQGVTGDAKAFTATLQDLAKAANAFQGTIQPRDIVTFAMQARQATPGFSQEFIGGVAPSLIQMMGGKGAGTALSSLYQALVGGRMKHTAVLQLKDLGLIADEDVERTTTGAIKGIKPGRHIKGVDLLKKDPYLWMQQFALPAMATKGITSEEDIRSTLATMFQERTSAQVAGIFATQQDAIERDRASIRKAQGLEGADFALLHDASLKYAGVTTQVTNLMGTLGAKTESATGALGALSGYIGGLNVAAQDMSNLNAAIIGVAGGLGALEIALLAAAASARTFGAVGAAGAAGGAAGVLGKAGIIGAGLYSLWQLVRPRPLNEGEKSPILEGQLRTPWALSPETMKNLKTDFKPVKLEPGMLTPQSMFPTPAKLEGEADVRVKVEVSPSADFVTKVEEAVSARGHMRTDRGVSMSPQ